jgi:aspartate kinase
MALIVQKYGGNLLSTPEKVMSVANKIKKLIDEGNQVVAIVSAMGKTTDELIDLAYKVSKKPIRRELDMLLSVGERISMSLLSMALNDLNVPAKSFTGSQSGILTESDHTQARIYDVKPIRIEAELAKKSMIIIAGFQGVSHLEKEITTLGRGGTDTTAVAMSYALKADRCEIIKEVGGIYSCDPNLISKAKIYKELNYETALEATYWGAKILHFRAVELAQKLKIPLQIKHNDNNEITTLIHEDTKMLGSHLESQKILTISSIKNVAICEFDGDLKNTLSGMGEALKKNTLPWPQILATETEKDFTRLFISSSDESLKVVMNAIKDAKVYKKYDDQHSTVTATCFGSSHTDLSLKIIEHLEKKKIKTEKIFYTPQSISVLVKSTDRESAIACLHELI